MRRIVVSMWTTLDGYVAGLDDEMDWLAPDDDMAAYETSLVMSADALLLGRVTHTDFAGAWPPIAHDADQPPETRAYARRVDEMPKFVVSRSGAIAEWDNTSRLDTLDRDTVADLKASGDGTVVIYGSLAVIAALQQFGAVDQYDLLVHPTALGTGKALFTSGTRLQLVSAEAFGSGVTLMRYTPAVGP
ncbi:dihydrofolate reductase family protein [Gordonia sp. PKS22-38]|uniref:Dihydrofolate reductase family protein n=1 Tax=Gordonia prachuapensis TaxID=3115651 RepID=A0ABU7MMK8_9ACTN|nr:dihydrofolate reductase family protein [Gordonia sp. PKS22-38]